MAKDWASDVKTYAPDADDGVIAGIVRYCGIALQKVDSSLVSFSDPVELARVRNNFLKKKCGLTDSDDVLDAAIADVGTRMKADRTKNRVTVYYLLSDRFGLHHLFVTTAKATTSKATGTKATAAKAAPLAAAAVGLAALDTGTDSAAGSAPSAAATEPVSRAVAAAPVAAPVVAAIAPPSAAPAVAVAVVGAAGATAALGLAPLRHPVGRTGVWGLLADGGAGKSGRLFWWLALGLLALALIWFFCLRKPADAIVVGPGASVAAPVTPGAPEAVVPEGAGVIAEVRNEKPVVKVYFATGKADVAPEFAGEAAKMKAYLDAHAGSTLGVSGYNDPTGNAAANATLSKKRAEAVKGALVAATIPNTAIELIKPKAATDATVTVAEARRVEVYIK